MAKTKPSKKTPYQRIREVLCLLVSYLKNACARCVKFLQKIYRNLKRHIVPLLGRVIALAIFFYTITIIYQYVTGDDKIRGIVFWYLGFLISIFLAMLPVIFREEWNFFIGDVSFKRIYRNSEGHIIPLLGGVFALAVFYSINAWLFTSATENNENREITLWSLGIFIVFLLVVWVVIYQLKKANLRDDTMILLEEMLIKHYAPYILSAKEEEEENISSRKFYPWTYLSFVEVADSLGEYMTHKNSKPLFNEGEIETMEEKIIKNIGMRIEEEMQTLPNNVKQQFEKQNNFELQVIIDDNKKYRYDILTILKEGNENNPKNLVAFRVDIEENKPPFVVLENLKPAKGEQKFLDINARQISCVEYQKDKVELTIIQPNASPRKITVSLSEWLANRNDLR